MTETVQTPAVAGVPSGLDRQKRKGLSGLGLSERLLLLTIAFVMLAEILIYMPSVANFRNNWLRDRLAQAGIAALVLEAAPEATVPESLVEQLLTSIQTKTIVLKIGGSRRLLALSDMPPRIDVEVDLRDPPALHSIIQSFDTLLFGADRNIRVIGPAPMGGDFIEIVLRENLVRDAMLRFSRNILLLSLVISAITAGLVYAALSWLIVRPVKRLAGNVSRFAEDPEDATRIISPGGRNDEIGLAERQLAEMQRSLHQHLQQKEHLAALGLAVAKINHDLRNMLASAQLFTDRLGELDDPTVQRFAPKLVQALDRAIGFCEATLAYGRAKEPPPVVRRFDLAPLARDVGDLLGLGEGSTVAYRVDMPAPFELEADPDQLFRVLNNLVRNAAAALATAEGQGSPRVTVSARRENGTVAIEVADNGPGIPLKARERLFKAFSGGAKRGSTGLGLAIAADLIRAHGGSIALVEDRPGAVFRMVLPQNKTPGI